MTRREFIETIEDFYDLKSFCDQGGISICDNVIDSEYYDEIIMDTIRDRGRFDTWQQAYHFLSGLPDDFDHYIEDDYGDFDGATYQDFEDYKQLVLDYVDTHEGWDSEETEVVRNTESEDPEISDEEFFALIGKAG